MTARLLDPDLRDPLFDYLERKFDKVRIIEEKTIGSSRADAFLVTEDKLIGIEIKSDSDTYSRLSRQIKDYDKYFDANIIAVGGRHTQVAKHVPDWWGIIACVKGEGPYIDFSVEREFSENPRLNRRAKLNILWRPELARIQERNGMHKYAQKSKAFVIRKILESVEPDILDRQICEELFDRDYTTIEQEIDTYKKRRRR